MVSAGEQSVPAHLGQRHLWLRDRYRGGEGLLAVPMVLRMRGDLDRTALERALAALVDRHEALRTTFFWKRGLWQTRHAAGEMELPLRFADTSGHPDPEAEARRQILDFLRVDTDIKQRCLDVALWRLAREDHLLVVNVHHLVTDGWSNMLLLRDLAMLYSGSENLPEQGWTFLEYASWYDGHMTAERLAKHQDFWRQQLEGARGVRFPGQAPVAEPSASGPRPRAVHDEFDLDATVIEGLQAIAKAERTTLYVVLLTIFLRTLQEASGQDDVTIGSIFANRSERAAQETVGLFANFSLIRASAAQPSGTGENEIRESIAQVRRFVLQALAHQELPYTDLPLDTMEPDWPARPDSVVFQMLAVPRQVPGGQGTGGTGLGFAGLDVESEFIPGGLSARFDLELTVLPLRADGADLRCLFRYAQDRHDPAFISALVKSYQETAGVLAKGAA